MSEIQIEDVVEGQPAPDFTLKDQNEHIVKFSDFKGRWVVLYFYPKDDTPGCTKEACGFRDEFKKFRDAGAVVLGVSLDDSQSHKKFIGKFQLNFPLLCDEDAKLSRLFGVYKKKTMFSNKFWGIERSTFVISPEGLVKKVFRKVRVDGHIDEVFNVIIQ